jgi:transcriptional regulator with XRE-family HTH domain
MVNNRIRKLRQEKGLTLKELSQQLADKGTPLSASSLIKYERGERKPSLETWIKLANFFNVPIAYIQGRSDIKDPITERNKIIQNVNNLSDQDMLKLLNKAFGVKYENEKIAEYFKISNAVLSDLGTVRYNYRKKLESNITDTDQFQTFVYYIETIFDMFLRASNETDQDSVNAYKKLKKLVDEYTQANHSQLNDKSSKK